MISRSLGPTPGRCAPSGGAHGSGLQLHRDDLTMSRLGIGSRNVRQRSSARIVRERKPPLSIDRTAPFTGESHSLVARRQGVNTFFLTINGAILTAVGLLIGNQSNLQLQAAGLTVLTITGAILALAWKSLIRSFGQLNTGKFAVINRIEAILPASVYFAEWQALEQGRNPKMYKTFTSREVWTPWTFFAVYCIAAVSSILVATGSVTLA